ncbi:ABC transporter C family member 3-like isoform X1 [Rutidosis leptorrhynchoides]|uniref:ABC transporter C family member 3-like isoform X1 n=1 Tax=Rutidosis leptorrhynchoides TaxID=125765 RepID=UPI003A99B806
MEDVEASFMGMPVNLWMISIEKMNDASNFLLVHLFSFIIHLGILLFVFVNWLCKRFIVKEDNVRKRMINNGASFYKQALFSCVVLVLLNIVMCFLSLFYWYIHRNGWTNENTSTFSDTILRTIVWLFVCVYLHTHVSKSADSKYPLVLRIWWVCFFLISCFCVVLDYSFYKHNRDLVAQYLVFNVLSSFVSLFLCYVAFWGRNEIRHVYEEPLLDGGADVMSDVIVTPLVTSNVLSLLTFSWIHPLISLGNKKPLNLNDVPQLDSENSAQRAFSVLRNKLELDKIRNSQTNTFNLVKALILTTWKDIITTAVLSLVFTLASYVGPYLMDTFVQYLNKRRNFNGSFFLVSAFFVAKIVDCLSQRQCEFKLQQAGIKVRAGLVAMIYHKGLTLSSQSKQGHSNGEIINFMAVDADRIGEFCKYMHNSWLVILQVGLALTILYKNIGISALATLVTTILVMLSNIPIGSFQEKFQQKLMKFKDKRMKTTSEILKNMRILKLYGWEMKFLSKINDIRTDESYWLFKYVSTIAMTNFAFWVAPTFVAIATFGTCMLNGVPLDSGKVLSTLATFKLLQDNVYNLPDTISVIAQTKVSLDRIASFFCLDDLDHDLVEMVPLDSSDTAVEIINGYFSWDVTSPNLTLTGINLRINHGMKVAVCGGVASGKSSLVSCMLGEIPKLSGKVKVSGKKAYVGQSSWIQSGKIEDNILFGKGMDRIRYNKVLEACDLKKDIEVLSFGDQTVIGERGINLSGGQKQRIQIARALYQDADIYLFDDPFSAVDAITGSHLFKECMMDFLESKTVIYVTHQMDFLPAADLILVLKDGRITQAGKYDNILNSGTDFIELVGAHREALLEIESAGRNLISDISKIIKEEVINGQSQTGKSDYAEGNKRQLVEEEERERGKVGSSAYWKYFTAAYGGVFVPLIILSQILFEAFQISSNYWLTWAAARVAGSELIIVYVALGVGSSFCILARSVFLMKAGYETANQLFYKMHFCIFRAPMSFFDANPSGRVLNRDML